MGWINQSLYRWISRLACVHEQVSFTYLHTYLCSHSWIINLHKWYLRRWNKGFNWYIMFITTFQNTKNILSKQWLTILGQIWFIYEITKRFTCFIGKNIDYCKKIDLSCKKWIPIANVVLYCGKKAFLSKLSPLPYREFQYFPSPLKKSWKLPSTAGRVCNFKYHPKNVENRSDFPLVVFHDI